jgi:hypothetical protein
MSKKNKKMEQRRQDQASNNAAGNTISWEIKEFEKHQRGRNWYIISGILALILIASAIYTNNYFFALIILMVTFIVIFTDQEEPKTLNFSLETEGIKLDNSFYKYDLFRDFSIIYKPKESISNLYMEFKNPFRPRLSVPLEATNPILVRNYLLRYVFEDLERSDIPFSESFAKLFKL